jgi:phosphoheptose isomerase
VNGEASLLESDFYRGNACWASQREAVGRAIDMLCDAYRSERLVLTCGNGGGAADSSHLTAELVKSFRLPRPLLPAQVESLRKCRHADGVDLAPLLERGLRAVSLSESTCAITAIANDTSPDMIFAQQVFALGRAGDLLMAFSTSGNSANVVRALQVAAAVGMKTVGFTGRAPARADGLCDVCLKADSEETYRVQELHMPLYHFICARVEEMLFG